ncbi:MAG: RpiB/LacA/LacB family sugar-phosphate isomerase, partial [Chloroflexi bacterium]|nr:RpiB/LacA/LacB family sugar-phosphate isomerase [Chloroflexota bacterium]
MEVAIGSDHAGYGLKLEIAQALTQAGIGHKDFGCYSTASADYPDAAQAVAQAVASGAFERGVLVCGTGVGMSIAANKVAGIRAALCHDTFSARATR